jgi:hypothetical protein
VRSSLRCRPFDEVLGGVALIDCANFVTAITEGCEGGENLALEVFD